MWSFGNDSAKYVIIFGFDNSSSCRTNNLKNNFLILAEDLTFGINGSFGASEKQSDINFRKAKTKFCLSLHYNADNSYLFVNGKQILNLRLVIKIITFHLDFVLEVYLINLTMLFQKKYLFREMCMVFQFIMMLLINLTF